MTNVLQQINALDKIDEIIADSDRLVILAYSLSLPIISTILSKLKKIENLRILYSAKTNAQRTINELKSINKKCLRPVEISVGFDHYESSHAKIYVFTKERE